MKTEVILMLRSKIMALSAALFMLFSAAAVQAQSVFNANLSAEEQQKLAAGEVVIRNTGSVSKLCVNGVNPVVQKALDTTKSVKPAYLAEIILVRPYKDGIIEQFEQLVTDIPSYVGIPYYSEHNGIWVDLYSSANTKSFTQTAGGTDAQTDLYMEPFGIITTDIHTECQSDTYYYESRNASKVKYNGITCVNKNNMRSIIVIFRDGDNLVFYGIGAVNAPTFSFIRDRVELSFMNRIKTFCNFFFEKLQQSGI